MKHFMLPRNNSILREAQPPIESPMSTSSPNPNSSKPKSLRRQKSSKENATPSDLNISDHKPSPAAIKIRSPLPPRPPSSNPLKRKLVLDTLPEISASNSSDSGVKVIVRVRPLNKDEESDDVIVQKVSNDSLSINGQTLTFDSVADATSTQLDIFQLVGSPLIENCLSGFNSSVFAYGQTGSGKTYTMWGPANALLEENLLSERQGLTPRVFQQLFARINEEQIKHADKHLTYRCHCSFLEIYNEQITDLLDPSQRNLQIREDVKSGVYVDNLTVEPVSTMKDVTHLLMKGLSNRRTGATTINSESSRSHSVFTCVVECRYKSMADGMSRLKTSRINLVDLAGSERQKLTGAAGERLKEAGNINRSLSQLGNLINILAEISQTGKERHKPYRDSKLTFLLQDSLGGNAKLMMVCAVSPAQSCRSETFSTLRFAQRAKAIKNKAEVNEETQDDVNALREIIRQLRDELNRMKSSRTNPTGASGGELSAGWARRSLNLLKQSLIHPRMLPHVEDDSDVEMEIEEDAVEKQIQLLCSQVEMPAAIIFDKPEPKKSESAFVQEIDTEDTDVNMEEELPEEVVINQDLMVVDCVKTATIDTDSSHVNIPNGKSCIEEGEDSDHFAVGTVNEESCQRISAERKSLSTSISQLVSEEPVSGMVDVSLCPVSEPLEEVSAADTSNGSENGSVICASPQTLSIIACDVSPVLKSPAPSVSPRISSSRKSLRTSSTLSASQIDPNDGSNSVTEAVHVSLAKSNKRSSSKTMATQTSKNLLTPTENLASSLHRGLEIIDSHRQSLAMRQSAFRFSFKPADLKPLLSIEKVSVGVQTLLQGVESEIFLCSSCKSRTQLEVKEANDSSDLPLVPVDLSESAEKSKKQVPKAVEKVLAGSIRREMALEEFCAKKTAEIMQLNRLVQQYKHERECNAILGQTREDKILRLESVVDGILPTAEFMEEELACLTQEHKILKDKYENHPEVLRTKIEMKRVRDELEQYRNFFDMGEREVLLEEIQDLRSQLQFYIDSTSMSARKRSFLQLTQSCEANVAPPLKTITESTEDCTEERFEQERIHWTEVESKWISLAEELRKDLEASRSLVEKQKQEIDTENRCAEELKEAMQMAMQGHARLLEQYADLQEKHIQLHARHRSIQEGIDGVKKAAAKAGVRGAESKFINALAAEISALKAEREKERRYFRDEIKGYQAQLRDTEEAVQAAGELLVRLKEAEEAVAVSQKRAMEAERETEKAHIQIKKLKRTHEQEIKHLNELLTESQQLKEAIQPAHSDSDVVRYDAVELQSESDQRWKEEFEPFYNGEDKLTEPSSWYSGYDRCNI